MANFLNTNTNMDTIKHIPENGKTRVVIIGGGFAGLKLARQLSNTKLHCPQKVRHYLGVFL